MTCKTHITADEIRKLVDYDPATGVLTWKPRTPDMFCAKKHTAEHMCNTWNARYAGKSAGGLSKSDGYIYLAFKVLGESGRFLAHRIAWLIVNGRWPDRHLDHIDRNKTNNRISNLRECDEAQNGWNVGKNVKNTTGYKNVMRHSQSPNLFYVLLSFRGKPHYGGIFDSAEKAHFAAEQLRARLHGEFARDD